MFPLISAEEPGGSGGREQVMLVQSSVVVKDDADITPGRRRPNLVLSFFRFTVGGIMSFVFGVCGERRGELLGRGGGLAQLTGSKDFPRGEEELGSSEGRE